MPETEQQTIDMGASMETEEALNVIDALNEVSDVLSMAGPRVTFMGTKVAALPNVGELAGVDVYSCPRGWFILFRTPHGPHWSAAGSSASDALAAIEDDGLRAAVKQVLDREGLL